MNPVAIHRPKLGACMAFLYVRSVAATITRPRMSIRQFETKSRAQASSTVLEPKPFTKPFAKPSASTSSPSFTSTTRVAAKQVPAPSPVPTSSPSLAAHEIEASPPVKSNDPGFPNAGRFDNEMESSDADLSTSYRGASQEPFPKNVIEVLLQDIPEKDIEIKPDGMIYLPEIKYRRILNRAFGPGGWGLVPRGPHTIGNRTISREYALFCLGRFVSQARGEQDYFSEDGLPTATEGCKSNALMRCCKDLGIASELWDPAFIRDFKARECVQVWAVSSAGAKKALWRRKDRSLDGGYREEGAVGATGTATRSGGSAAFRKQM
ncbi:hypothetical protein HDU97_000019 [Phlyctochytrium planicorne]|nr:hypothetical protein HDU97_000019 [Phlyctochytrium planicorne]